LSDKVNVSGGDFLPMFIRSDANVLGANVTDIGDIFAVGQYSHISGYVFSDVSSASPGIIIEQAKSRTDFALGAASTTDVTRSTESVAGGNIDDNAIAVQIVAPFARIVYVNGGSAQAQYTAFFGARLIRGL
jgi:hypothetical protein